MIISASYRTDIPAFYGKWFMNRLDAGYCKVRNPYNENLYRVSLDREDVDGFVFWTKNLGPFLDYLKVVRDREFPFMVQYTINGYPRTLEFSVVDAHRSVDHMKALAETYGDRVAVWRYDTIVYSSAFGVNGSREFHISNFERLAKGLAGTTDEVVISFAQIYKKTKRNMNWAAEKFDFTWEDPTDEEKIQLVHVLTQIASSHGMQLNVCSQLAYAVAGAGEARCIDTKRLSDIAQRPIRAKLKGNRPECGCFLSRDIGAYDTCPHGCVYCYAVENRELAQQRYQEHDPDSELLFGQADTKEEATKQPRLF